MSEWSKKHTVMHRYNQTAKMYDMRYAEEQAAKYEAALEMLKLPPDGLALDIGCGTGLLFKDLIDESEIVVGLDISKNLLLEAKEKARRFPGIYLVQSDADFLPFKDGLFKVISLFTVLQNMPRPLETLKEAKRIAKPEAYLAVTGLKKAFSFEDFRELLRSAGFKVVSINDDDALKCYVAVACKT